MDTTARSNWTTSLNNDSLEPLLTTEACFAALTNFFQNEHQLLAVATEASSHPSGLDSLYAQPWVYAGGGLGNIDECPAQVCLAGGASRDSLIFASVCVVPECHAQDLAAGDFTERLETAAFSAATESVVSLSLSQEYVTLHQRIARLNSFLHTGWICGEYVVHWEVFPSFLYLLVVFVLVSLSLIGTFQKQKRRPPQETLVWQEIPVVGEDAEEKKEVTPSRRIPSEIGDTHSPYTTKSNAFWSSWDMRKHLKNLQLQRPDTACLDGLKVGSILWVISGHVMAIQSSSGGGYSNPRSFLPPDGLTTTVMGQMLFSSRFAVDTFLCLSGFLVVYVLRRKLPECPTTYQVASVLALRVLRILPLYVMSLGFWMFVAPHLGSGPFWYQWRALLEPCQNLWWANALFINNFVPWDLPTTETCFYHSWYLAVDIQLFFLFAPWLVMLHKKSPGFARSLTFLFWTLSVGVTAYLSHSRRWSVNTFDGAAVALFDVEGYAKPHVRAQSYLAGMFVAMLPRMTSRRRTRDKFLLILSLVGLALLTFITATGAYGRRACRYEEWPSIDECGSTWSAHATFLYTAFSRATWSICIALVIRLCLEGRGFALGTCLSWRLWTPLAHLSFGAYLVHPIVIFTWQLGTREKGTFQLLSFFMDFISVTVVSFAAAAFAALTVEFPVAALVQTHWRRQSDRSNREQFNGLISLYEYGSYGTVSKSKHRDPEVQQGPVC
jgi:peptidoglycan/LPS O-acetylase OafA/YrhL